MWLTNTCSCHTDFRLRHHCWYFWVLMINDVRPNKGKKLSGLFWLGTKMPGIVSGGSYRHFRVARCHNFSLHAGHVSADANAPNFA